MMIAWRSDLSNEFRICSIEVKARLPKLLCSCLQKTLIVLWCRCNFWWLMPVLRQGFISRPLFRNFIERGPSWRCQPSFRREDNGIDKSPCLDRWRRDHMEVSRMNIMIDPPYQDDDWTCAACFCSRRLMVWIWLLPRVSRCPIIGVLIITLGAFSDWT